MIGDLHCHSSMSDGSTPVDQLVEYAIGAGMDFISLTDHDTMAGVERAVSLGKRKGIRVIPETITATQAFALDELGWWQEHVYRSTIAANVYTPEQYAAGWELVR